MLNNLQGATFVDRFAAERETDDPDDAWLLALADAGRADYLVTGDKRSGLLQRGRVAAAQIVTARAFIAVLE
jgi:predicted nucleic acid-binding protein